MLSPPFPGYLIRQNRRAPFCLPGGCSRNWSSFFEHSCFSSMEIAYLGNIKNSRALCCTAEWP